MSASPDFLPLDTSDIDRHLGKPSGGAQLREAIAIGDIRAWVQAMHNANPLHYDEAYAAKSPLGRLVAPQSFASACDQEHGVLAAHEGEIPGSHILWGGSEWFFFGPHIEAGDRIRCDRMPFDYRVSNTRFAGPTVFQRGDTLFVNQRGEVICRSRSTAVRYLIENARRVKAAQPSAPAADEEPDWSAEELERIHEQRYEYVRSYVERTPRTAQDLREGEQLVRGVLGPHSIASFATEWRSYLWARGWGSNLRDDPQAAPYEAGFELGSSGGARRRGRLDPEQLDIIYYGQARGHLNPKYARLIGMPRCYGFGASLNAWVLDYVGNWAGPHGFITHSVFNSRAPALVGDVTFLDGTVNSVGVAPRGGKALASVRVRMSSYPAGQELGVATVNVEFA